MLPLLAALGSVSVVGDGDIVVEVGAFVDPVVGIVGVLVTPALGSVSVVGDGDDDDDVEVGVVVEEEGGGGGIDMPGPPPEPLVDIVFWDSAGLCSVVVVVIPPSVFPAGFESSVKLFGAVVSIGGEMILLLLLKCFTLDRNLVLCGILLSLLISFCCVSPLS